MLTDCPGRTEWDSGDWVRMISPDEPGKDEKEEKSYWDKSSLEKDDQDPNRRGWFVFRWRIDGRRSMLLASVFLHHCAQPGCILKHQSFQQRVSPWTRSPRVASSRVSDIIIVLPACQWLWKAWTATDQHWPLNGWEQRGRTHMQTHRVSQLQLDNTWHHAVSLSLLILYIFTYSHHDMWRILMVC